MKRSNFFDIIKGIGILSVVIGHCCHNSLRKFVYTYHLVIFFFIAGYFYNKKKYENDPFLHLATRIKSNWSRYCFYSFIFVLLHNVFFNMNILGDSPSKYFLHDFVTNCCNSLIFMCGELFSGALWFVPVLIFTMSIFGGLVYISNKTKKLNRDYSMLTLIFLCLITGLFGIVINLKSIYLAYHFQTSFLVIPIVLLGYLCKEYLKEEKNKKILQRV